MRTRGPWEEAKEWTPLLMWAMEVKWLLRAASHQPALRKPWVLGTPSSLPRGNTACTSSVAAGRAARSCFTWLASGSGFGFGFGFGLGLG